MRRAAIFLLLIPFPALAMDKKEIDLPPRDILAAATLKKLVEVLPQYANSAKSLRSFASDHQLPNTIADYPPLAPALEWVQANFSREQLASFSFFRTKSRIETYEEALSIVSEEDKLNVLNCKAPQASPRGSAPERPVFCPTSPRNFSAAPPSAPPLTPSRFSTATATLYRMVGLGSGDK